MAILKHLSSKNSDYSGILDYLMYEHDRFTNKPLRDEDGLMVMRENFLIDALETSVATFDMDCMNTNARFHKNNKREDVKSHHYIISFDPKDSADGRITMEKAQSIGMEFAKKNFPGHEALIATHDDGDNHSGNMHVHIVINSVRCRDVNRQVFMERNCDSKAGYKHHLTDKYLRYLKQDLMDICEKEKLNQVDLLSPAKKKITEKEYWICQRGSRRMDRQLSGRHNRPDMHMDSNDKSLPHKSPFVTQKEALRMAIKDIAKDAVSEGDFGKKLKEKYNITFKVSRGRYSYVHPHRNKAITGRALGTDYTEVILREVFERNTAKFRQKNTRHKDYDNAQKTHNTDVTFDGVDIPNSISKPSRIDYVRDLQLHAINSINRYQDRNSKIRNIKAMADTINYIDEHGFESRDELIFEHDTRLSALRDSKAALKASEKVITGINEQIHYTGQYLVNKKVYKAFINSKNKAVFRHDHSDEIMMFESARNWLKKHVDTDSLPSKDYIKTTPGDIPNLKDLKVTSSVMIEKQKKLRKHYNHAREQYREIDSIKRNVDTMLADRSITRSRTRDKNMGLE